jgi:phage replication-related protein YjqB (UPF0714/DUF867 family)
MADMFNNYAELSAVYVEGTDYRVTLTKKIKDIGITAYHGGGIEIGSTELMQYIYEKKTTWSWYGFEGLLSADNSNLHITSTHYDEPRGMDFVSYVNRAVSLHGASGTDPITYIGGMDVITKAFIKSRLEAKGFVVTSASTESGIAGETVENFVNRPPKGGVQLEMSTQLRKSFFLNDDWSKTARSNKANWTQKLKDYGDAVMEGIEMALALKTIGTGQLTLSDLNDAIISGTAPVNPTVGTLWIDTNGAINILKEWNGNAWISRGDLDPQMGTKIDSIQTTLGNMANDDKIDIQERRILKDKLTEILGTVMSDTATTMPTTATLDSSGKGSFYQVRKSALLVGISTGDTKYLNVATQYNNLKTYLEGLTPVEVWDVRAVNKDVVINVTKATFRDKWLQYFNAVNDLLNAIDEKQKANVDNIEIGHTNYGSNGNFEMDITTSLWKDSYTGQLKEVVDIGTETPPHKFAYHVKNTTNANGGIFTPTLFSGAVANNLLGKEITVSFWLKYTGIVVGANSWNNGRFGEIIISAKKADASMIYTYPAVLNVSGSNAGWVKYSKTIKIDMPTGGTEITNIQFKHGMEGCTGEFWTTGIKIEFGNKVTDWSQSPLDLQQRLTSVEFKVSDNEIISKVTSSSKYMTDFQAVNTRIDMAGSAGVNLVDGSEFKTLPLSWNGAGLLLVEGASGQPNSLIVSKPAGGASYAFTLYGTSMFKKDEYYTISFEAKTDGTLDQFNYIYLRGNGVSNYQVPTSITIDKTNTTGFVFYSVTVKAPYDFPANAGIMIGTNGQTAPFEIRKPQIERGGKASDWKSSNTDRSNALGASMDASSMVTNSTFYKWGGTHSKYPTGMTHWTGTFYGQRELTLTKNGGNALRFQNTGTNDAGANLSTGFFKPNLANTKYLMVEVDFYVNSGTDLTASGILIDWLSNGSIRRQHRLQDMVNETIVTGKWYSGRKLFVRPTDTVTGFTGAMSGYIMANWATLGTKADKDIIFDRLSVREATVEEIKAYSADATIADMMSDMKITPVEKSTLKQTWDNIKSEYAILVAQAQATAVTYSVYNNAYTVLNGSTPKIESEILASMTTTYTFASTTARDTFKTQLNTYYNEALRLRKTIDDVLASPKNLILNSTFNRKDDAGALTSWNNVNAVWKVIDPESDKPTSNILKATATGNTTNPIYSAHSNWFTVKQGDIFTFAIDFKVTSATAWDVKNPFIIEFWDSATTSTRVQYQDVSATNLGVTTVADNTWYRGSITVQVTSATATRGRIRLGLFKNGELFIREVQVQRGHKATDYQYAPEDTYEQINLIQEQVNQAMTQITSDAIIDTVTKGINFDAYALADKLGDYATNTDLDGAVSDTLNEVDNKIKAIDYSDYVTQSQFTRTASDITAKFKSSGGINMLRNSVGFSYLDFWTISGAVETTTNRELEGLGYTSGFMFRQGVAGYIEQNVYTVVGQQYTVSFLLNKTKDNTTNNYAGMDIYDANGGKLIFTGLGTGLTSGYDLYSFTFVAPTAFVKIRFTVGSNAEAIITGAMCNIGDQPLQWSMHPQEIYNTNIRMDLNGIRVTQIDSTDASNPIQIGYTVMTPDKFAGYYDVNGDGVIDSSKGSIDEVFRMDKDEFVMKKANVKEEITMGTIKVIKIDTAGSPYVGWAFVSNQTS